MWFPFSIGLPLQKQRGQNGLRGILYRHQIRDNGIVEREKKYARQQRDHNEKPLFQQISLRLHLIHSSFLKSWRDGSGMKDLKQRTRKPTISLADSVCLGSSFSRATPFSASGDSVLDIIDTFGEGGDSEISCLPIETLCGTLWRIKEQSSVFS